MESRIKSRHAAKEITKGLIVEWRLRNGSDNAEHTG